MAAVSDYQTFQGLSVTQSLSIPIFRTLPVSVPPEGTIAYQQTDQSVYFSNGLIWIQLTPTPSPAAKAEVSAPATEVKTVAPVASSWFRLW